MQRSLRDADARWSQELAVQTIASPQLIDDGSSLVFVRGRD
jgi:hypothetical protein